jgi:hypothetical protein
MLAKHQKLCASWDKVLNGGVPEELGQRIVGKARNAANVARERQRKKTPQQRDPRKEAWAGIVCVVPTGNAPLVDAMKLFEHVRMAAAILRREGYAVEADNYLEGEGDDQVYIAGIRFIDVGKRST